MIECSRFKGNNSWPSRKPFSSMVCCHSFASCATISLLGYGAVLEQDFRKAMLVKEVIFHDGGLDKEARKAVEQVEEPMVVPSSASLVMDYGLRVRTKAPKPVSTSELAGGGGGIDVGVLEKTVELASSLFDSIVNYLVIRFFNPPLSILDKLIIMLTYVWCRYLITILILVNGTKVFDGEREKNPRWVRTKIDFEDHFIIPNLDPNMDKPDRFVEDHASDLSKVLMDLSKPLWEFHILNIKISNADAVRISKIHHSIGDGMSLVSLVLSMSRKSSHPEELPSIPTSRKKESPFASGPFRCLVATINDVIVGLTDAALSRYLHRKCGDQLQKNVRLRASVVANVRQTAGLQDLADMMEKGSKCRWGNEVGVFLVPFHVSLEEDPLEYVRRANTNLNQKKLLLEAALILCDLAAAALTHKVLFNSTLMVSNVLGPAEEITFCGQGLAYIAPTGWGLPLVSQIDDETRLCLMLLRGAPHVVLRVLVGLKNVGVTIDDEEGATFVTTMIHSKDSLAPEDVKTPLISSQVRHQLSESSRPLSSNDRLFIQRETGSKTT
ncbi:Wax ester synthase/diacylglycerol acyltransferase 2-like protein [Drosera capensis]